MPVFTNEVGFFKTNSLLAKGYSDLEVINWSSVFLFRGDKDKSGGESFFLLPFWG